LIKKMLLAIVPLAAFVALAIAPLSAQGDTICPKGTKNPRYCVKKCKVPQLKGKTPGQAGTLLRQHDCKLGKTTKARGSGVPKGKILRSTPAAGTVHQQGFKVNIIVRK
jgi:PASTA domain